MDSSLLVHDDGDIFMMVMTTSLTTCVCVCVCVRVCV